MRDFAIADSEAAYILPAKAIAMTIIDLLADGAREGHRAKNNFVPSLNKQGHLDFWREQLGFDCD